LADTKTRSEAVAEAVAAGYNRVPLLLAWSRKPPAGIDRDSLNIGLADIFGRLRVKESIPFLITNISAIRRTRADFAPWMKTPESIEDDFPAIAALIQIGPEAGTALIRAAQGPMLAMDRRAAVFAVSRIKGVPESRAFLSSVVAEAYQEGHWAEEGIRSLDAQR
jgi:hypothetical protein